MTTVPLRCDGKALVVNARAKQGSINVAILDLDGKPISGFDHQDCNVFSGDKLSHPMTWANGRSLAALQGRPVRVVHEVLSPMESRSSTPTLDPFVFPA